MQKPLKLDKAKLSKTLVHEIQHAIQDIEGFASGSNTEYWRDVGIPESKLREYYEKTAGEIEARDVENRLELTMEQRKNTRPDIDRTDVVFADDSVYGNSIIEPFIDKNGNQIGDEIFGSKSKNEWEKIIDEKLKLVE